MWSSWIRLSTAINLLCSIAKAVSWFTSKNNSYVSMSIGKLMLWILISLNLQYYNHRLLGYNHRKVIRSLPWEEKSGVTFVGQFFSLYLRKLQTIVLLYLSVFYILLQSDNFISYICKQTIVRREWQYSHTNESNSATAKEDVKQKFNSCDVIWTLTF